MPKPLIVDEIDAKHHLQTKASGSDLWSRSTRLTKSVRRGARPSVPENALFQAYNITGVTDLHGSEPSVYYQSGDTFSYITTNHLHADNIGRSKVRTHADYHVAERGVTRATMVA